MSRCLRGFYWLSYITRFFYPLLLTGLLEKILYPYRAVVDKFLLVVQHLQVHVKGSIRECRFWIRAYSSNSVPYVLFVLFGWL